MHWKARNTAGMPSVLEGKSPWVSPDERSGLDICPPRLAPELTMREGARNSPTSKLVCKQEEPIGTRCSGRTGTFPANVDEFLRVSSRCGLSFGLSFYKICTQYANKCSGLSRSLWYVVRDTCSSLEAWRMHLLRNVRKTWHVCSIFTPDAP